MLQGGVVELPLGGGIRVEAVEAVVAPVDYAVFESRMDNQRAAVMQIADAAGFQFIDLLDPFVREASNTAYYTYDSHWNETGHRLAAQTVAGYIRGKPCTEKPS